MPKKKKITKEGLEKYILECIEYRDESYTSYIANLQEMAAKFSEGSNPPTEPPKPPILK